MTRTDSDSTDLTPAPPASEPSTSEFLYFFPDRSVTDAEARTMLSEGRPKDRAWVVSHLLRYAQWDDIWTYVDRDEVREIFEHLDLPVKLQAAWARMLKIATPVG